LRDTDLDIVVYEGVYAPAEDTYLLMDSLEIDDYDYVLEIGCGSGLVTTAVARVASRVVATDISRLALKNTRRNLKVNTGRRNWSLLQTDLLSSFRNVHDFSVILFNPPYIPKDTERTALDSAFIGGESGIELTVEFLKQAKQRVCEDSTVYTIASSIADVDGLLRNIDELDLEYEIIKRKRMFFEELLLLKIAIR
jgi:release factor glutamine methyltransferase